MTAHLFMWHLTTAHLYTQPPNSSSHKPLKDFALRRKETHRISQISGVSVKFRGRIKASLRHTNTNLLTTSSDYLPPPLVIVWSLALLSNQLPMGFSSHIWSLACDQFSNGFTGHCWGPNNRMWSANWRAGWTPSCFRDRRDTQSSKSEINI